MLHKVLTGAQSPIWQLPIWATHIRLVGAAHIRLRDLLPLHMIGHIMLWWPQLKACVSSYFFQSVYVSQKTSQQFSQQLTVFIVVDNNSRFEASLFSMWWIKNALSKFTNFFDWEQRIKVEDLSVRHQNTVDFAVLLTFFLIVYLKLTILLY